MRKLALLVLLGSATAFADPDGGVPDAQVIQLPTDSWAPKVSAAASPTVVSLGQPFTVFITATAGAGVTVNIREPMEFGAGLEVRRKLAEATRVVGAETVHEWQLEVLAWEVGDLAVPGIAVTYTAYGKVGQVQTNGINLKVVGVLGDVVDDPKMRDHHPPTTLIRKDWFWLYVGIGAVTFVVVLVGGLWWQARRRRRRMQLAGSSYTSMPRRIDMTSTRALEQLLAIEKTGVLDREEDRKRGHQQMVDVFREYLGGRYHVATLDLTTSEVLARIKPVAPEEELVAIEAWLESCDLVKYGGLKKSGVASRATLEEARALVISTTQGPAEATAPTEEAA